MGEETPMNTKIEGKKWLEDILEIESDIDIVDCYRLGKKGDRPRPIKIDLKTEDQQKKIFNNRKVLIDKENGKYKKVYINTDKTRMQREEQKMWRENRRKLYAGKGTDEREAMKRDM